MKDIRIEIDGEVLQKALPSVKDWYDNQDVCAALEGKNALTDREATDIIIKCVADFIGTTPEAIKEHCDMNIVMSSYRAIQANILECFTGQKTPDIPTPKK